MVLSYNATILYDKGNNRIESIKMMHITKKLLSDTLKVFQNAVSYIIDVVVEHYDLTEDVTLQQAQRSIEVLIHNTKDNFAIYDFDEKFKNFPSYFRRDAISYAVGAVKSYNTLKTKYDEKRYNAISNGKKFKEKAPTLNHKPNAMPTFFKGNMYMPFSDDDNEVQIKLYDRGNWKYFTFHLQQRDLKYIRKTKDELVGKLLNPVLEYSYGRFHLRYGIEFKNLYAEMKKVDKMKILSVDLGINNDATCSVMCGDSTIVHREFINLRSEKAELYRLLNRKKKLQSLSGNYKYAPTKKIMTKINGINDNLSNQVVHRIVELARLYSVDVVVFEHLSPFNGKKKEKIHYWRKKSIIHKCCGKLHAYGIRYATVNPKNTSAFAYDGSGRVVRDEKNYSLCTFKNKKRYNCDLSASYNIGARYFIREFLKLGEVQKIAKSIEIPSACNRTYSDFVKLVNAVC